MVVQTHNNNKRMEGNQNKVEANISLLGAENVGKSALTVRFLTRRFIGEYGDIECIYTHREKVDGRDVCLNIWDSTCPQDGEDPSHISERLLGWSDGFLLVYSICDRDSFNVVRQQVQQIRRRRARSGVATLTPLVVVGNKRDLRHGRVVSAEEGRSLALWARCAFFEVSAAEAYHGVPAVFHQLVRLVREARAPRGGAAGLKGIVRSVSAVFGRKRTE